MEVLICASAFMTFGFVYFAYQMGHSRGYWRGYYAAVRETRRIKYILELEDEGN